MLAGKCDAGRDYARRVLDAEGDKEVDARVEGTVAEHCRSSSASSRDQYLHAFWVLEQSKGGKRFDVSECQSAYETILRLQKSGEDIPDVRRWTLTTRMATWRRSCSTKPTGMAIPRRTSSRTTCECFMCSAGGRRAEVPRPNGSSALDRDGEVRLSVQIEERDVQAQEGADVAASRLAARLARDRHRSNELADVGSSGSRRLVVTAGTSEFVTVAHDQRTSLREGPWRRSACDSRASPASVRRSAR